MNTFPVLEIAERLDVIDRVDRVSYRQLPVRLSTLVRRTVRALPDTLRGALEHAGAATPLDPAATLLHARALATLLEVVENFESCDSLPDWLRELRDATHELLVSAGRVPPADEGPGDELITALVDDALIRYRATIDSSEIDENWHRAQQWLDHCWVTLAQEELATRDERATVAAFRLSCDTASSHVSLALYYAELAMAWWPHDELPVAVRAHLVDAAVDAGEYARAVEVGEALLPLLEAPRETDTWWLFAGCRALVSAFLETGESARAVETAGLAAWAAEQALGPDHWIAIDAYGNLARAVRRNGEPDRAAELLEQLLAKQRPRVDNIARELAYTGLLLAATYQELDRHADAARLGTEMLRLSETRLGPSDSLTTSLREFLHELDVDH